MPATEFLMRCMGHQGCLRVKDLKCVEERMVFLTVKLARLDISVTHRTPLKRRIKPHMP